MEQVSITREMDASGGRYTLTPVPLRHRGIATQLVLRLVADARREGFRIRPTCPFVVTQFESHPEWSDLLA